MPIPRTASRARFSRCGSIPTTVSNVVTYTVVVEAANRELKLLPGMTANLVFQIEKRENVLTVPNAALRFHPKPEQVRKSDLAIVEGRSEDDATGDSPTDPAEKKDPAAVRARKPTYVWVLDGNQIAAVEIVTGLADKSGTEIVSGEPGRRPRGHYRHAKSLSLKASNSPPLRSFA